MTDLYIDYDTYDLVVVNGDLQFVPTAQELCRQAVVTTLKAFKGEWFRNIEYGTPWVENDNNTLSILGKSGKVFFDSQIREAILSNPEVISIVSYKTTLNKVTGAMSLDATIESAEGNILISQPINI